MEFKGVVKYAKNNEITLRLKDKVDIKALSEKAIGEHIYGVFEVYEKDTITQLQRKHFYALLGDYSEYTGVPLDATESYFKYRFMVEEGLDELPSVARNMMKKSTASKLLTFIITDLIHKEIPFRKQQFYLTTDTNKMLYAMTLKRLCVVCGKPNADIAHFEAVGQGRNRRKINHEKHHLLSLCREHHTEQHTIGWTEFMNKYHVKPIKLDNQAIKQLGI